MSNLSKYIRQILSRKEEVILPGFGSLLMSESTGMASSTGRINPPGAIIKFDASHPKGDGKLAQEYADGEGLDYEEGRQQVLELVDKIKFSLDKGEACSIETLGTFTRDDNNKIHFQKDPKWVIDPEMFGLSSFEMLELDSEEAVSDSDSRKTETDPVASASAAATQGASGGSAMPEKGKVADIKSSDSSPPPRARRRPVNKWRIIWIVVGSLAAVLVLILLIPTGSDIEIGKEGIIIKDTTSETVREQTNDETTAPENLPENTVEMIQPEGEAQVPEEEVQPEAIANENHYFVIAGSFQSLPNATDLMNELKDKGFPSEIIITENRMYRVSVQSFATKNEAFGRIDQIKASTGLPSVWVMTR